MAAKSSRGGKYIRKDGTTIADDHINRRGTVTSRKPGTNDAGVKREFNSSNLKHYKLTFENGTSITIVGKSPKDVRSRYKDRTIKKLVRYKSADRQ